MFEPTAYVWSKTLGTASLQTTGNVGNSANTSPEDYHNIWLDKQRADNDRTHIGRLDGTVRVNTVTGPGMHDVDASIFRDINVYEKTKLQIRGDAVNVFNFFTPANPGVTLNSTGSAGLITNGLTQGNTGGARVIQVGARLLW